MRIIIPFLIFSCIILHPLQIQNEGLLYGGVGSDDFCYMATATSIAYGEWPNYSKEEICHSEMPMASIGPGILASPFVFAFSLVDRIEGNSITQQRTAANLVNSATSWGFLFATLFYFGLCLCLLRKLLLEFKVSERMADWAIVFMILCQGPTLYVERRPVFSHIYELLSLTALLLFSKNLSKRSDLKTVLTGGALCFFAATCRYNDIPLAFSWPLIFSIFDENGKLVVPRDKALGLLKIFSVFVLLFILFKVFPTIKYGGEKYSGMAKSLLLSSQNFEFWMGQIWSFFVGPEWGLIFTAPFLILGGIGLIFFDFPDKRRMSFIAATLLVNFYLTLRFGTNGGWYGYRYFIFSAMPVLVVPLAHVMSRLEKKYRRRFWIASIVIAIPPMLSMLLFEGNDSLIMTQMNINGFSDWGNIQYQFKVWKTLFLTPMEFLRIVFKGVPIYFIYCLGKIFGLVRFFPTLVVEKFAGTGMPLFFQTWIMLVVPTLPLLCGRRQNTTALAVVE